MIFDWIKYAGVNEQIQFQAYDISDPPVYIARWSWNPADDPVSTTGYYAWSHASYSFGSTGVYYCDVTAYNQYGLYDYDYGVME